MNNIKNIRFKGYKAFSNDIFAELNNVSKVNVIIGKNNSGKTSLLETVEMVYTDSLRIEADVIQIDFPFEQKYVNAIFSGYSSINSWTPKSFYEYAKENCFSVEIGRDNNLRSISNNYISNVASHVPRLINNIKSDRNNYIFRKISAERNIVPEPEDRISLSDSGVGASNIIRAFLNESIYEESVIEKDLLLALNSIVYPEAEYENIKIQQVESQGQKLWEVFLQEKGMKRVSLSKTGSGVKTIVLVLLNLIILPEIKEYRNKKIVYGFEELENNLHPALQRRLFEYIYEYALRNEVVFYITTHSHIAINAFYDKENASIYHVVKENGYSRVKGIETYIDKREILQDLDIKASDIFQSNGIIWVEGPSDRIYIKRWIELFTENKYIEGKDYQFLYYGGRLLSHYSAEEETELINIITTNRNAAIVIDSDKRYKSQAINATKKRIVSEFDKLNMFSWVTKGKEIENYIPKAAVENMMSITLKRECGQYKLFPQYIEKNYNNFSTNKVSFANKIKSHITKENSEKMFDLAKKVEELYLQIKKWNS